MLITVLIKQYVKTKKAKRLTFTNALIDSTSIIVVLDTCIKNDIVIFISHVYFYSNSIKKTIHHTVNISLTKVELFAIRCRINQAVQISKMSYIIIITNAIHLAKKIFNSMIYPYQLQSIVIA